MQPLLGRRGVVVALAAGLLVVVVAASLALGVRDVPPSEVWRALVDPVSGDVDHDVIRGQRLPRTVIGLVAGVALGVAGTLVQGVTRNPIADPGLLGLNAGAALALVLASSVLGITAPLGFVWFAFLGSALAAVVVFSIGHGRPVHLALAGATLTALLTPLTALALLGDYEAFQHYRFWAVGALTGRDLTAVAPLWPFVLAGGALAVLVAPRLNALALGDDVAAALGQRVAVTRGVAAVAVVALSGTATALAGPIALVGLVVPHATRRLVGSDHRWMVPVAALLGPALLLAADVIGRQVMQPGELEAGVVVAFVGAPVLVAVARGRRVAGL
ncbi:MAG TPA: iron chelate uptake ABC transporter family permease subunit [Nocardioides sp.]|nr:iron chelate uptake ABC transporter family permease subunit [Nocardioides sp.]